MNKTHKTNDSKKFELMEKMKATIKEIFDMKSKKGINVAGKTIKLDKI